MDNRFARKACFIGGRWVGRAIDARIAVTNPATGAVIGSVPDLGVEQANEAIEAARAALPGWRSLPAADRARRLRRLYELLVDNRDELARLLTAEQGKPLTEARGEISYAAAFVEWFAEEAKRIRGETIPARSGTQRLLVVREPVGVCAAITPWNFPSAMLARKLAPALAAGCTIVCKPAEDTPLSGLAWGALCEMAGIPEGVVNIITGAPEPIGRALMESPVVRKVSFTGSTEVGKVLIRQSADTVKKLSLELGGNAPFIVFEDADLDRAVAGAIASKYRNSGQTCVCANRFLVHEDISAAFETELKVRAEALVVGNGADDGVDLGPLINRAAVDKVRRLVKGAVDAGARAIVGGEPAGDSLFCGPVVLSGVTDDMEIAHVEIFGPVAAIRTFTGEAQAVSMANNTRAGLAAYVYTRDPARMLRVGEALEYGMVGVNESMISDAMAPFGGVKESGFGREGSRHGIDEYLQMKYLCMSV